MNAGPPFPSARAYILNDHRELQSPRTLGNIFVAGVQISRGYINQPDATAKVFFPDPFFPEHPNERMYNTGDVGFWDADGNIHCCGRKDRQVKVRGFRVNLDGISNIASLRMPTVGRAAAVVRDGAIMLFVEPAEVDTGELRARLKECLPPHSIPRSIHAFESIPLSQNGKIDVKHLTTMEINNGTTSINAVTKQRKQHLAKEIENNGIPGHTSDANLEKLISQEWQQLLGLDSSQQLSSSDNFSLLGGDSIRQLNLAARLRSLLGLPIKVKDIIRASTLGDLVSAVNRQQKEHGNGAIVDHSRGSNSTKLSLGYKALSPPEIEWTHRYCHSHVQTTFNVSYAARLSPEIDWKLLANSLETVLNRHRVLKSRFIGENDEARKRVLSEQPIPVMRTAQDINIKDVINQPFRIDEALVNAIASPSSLVLCISHVVCDLTAMDTLLHEVTSVYRGLELPPVLHEYFDVSWYQTADPEKQRFWAEYLRGLDLGHSKGSGQLNENKHLVSTKSRKSRSYQGTSRITSLPDSLYRHLTISSTKKGFTFHQFGMAVTGLVLHLLCGRDDIVLGCPFINRSSIESRPVVGLFLEPLPVRISVESRSGTDGDPHIREFIRSVQESSQLALAHSMPWSNLMHQLGLPFPSSEPQLFSCCVTFHDDRGTAPPLSIDGVEGQYMVAEGAKFPLLVEWHAHRAVDGQERLTMRIEYDTNWLSTQFIEIIEALLVQCFRILSEDDSRSHEDVRQQLNRILEYESMRLGVSANEIHEMAQEYLRTV